MAVFPHKNMLNEAIQANSYATWPDLTVNLVKNHFSESNETQQVHMKNVW